jgi:transposase
MEQWVRKHTDGFVPVVYTMEATGIYHEQLAWHLFSQKQAVSVVLPDKARQYAGPADQIVHLIS